MKNQKHKLNRFFNTFFSVISPYWIWDQKLLFNTERRKIKTTIKHRRRSKTKQIAFFFLSVKTLPNVHRTIHLLSIDGIAFFFLYFNFVYILDLFLLVYRVSSHNHHIFVIKQTHACQPPIRIHFLHPLAFLSLFFFFFHFHNI